jgi:two-component system alkaline phosphatase synthesis response regulator PhoP
LCPSFVYAAPSELVKEFILFWELRISVVLYNEVIEIIGNLATQPTRAKMPTQNGNGRKRVLIVDDEDLTRILLSQVLERANVGPVEVLMAEDGEQAVQIAEQSRPDLVLLDLLMPKMNGYDVCKHLRAIPDYAPYIIILTARGQNTDRQQAKDSGANDFMTKPFNPSGLLAQLRALWGSLS